MTRAELLKSREYWIGEIQQELFELIEEYLKENNLSSKNHFLVFTSNDELFLFKKLPKKKLIEYGYEKYLEYKNINNPENNTDRPL